jgi:hypothetical protein
VNFIILDVFPHDSPAQTQRRPHHLLDLYFVSKRNHFGVLQIVSSCLDPTTTTTRVISTIRDTTKVSTTTTSTNTYYIGGKVPNWGQCAGIGYTGPNECELKSSASQLASILFVTNFLILLLGAPPWYCQYYNVWFSQCLAPSESSKYLTLTPPGKTTTTTYWWKNAKMFNLQQHVVSQRWCVPPFDLGAGLRSSLSSMHSLHL